MSKLDDFRKFMLNQELFEREVDEIIRDYNIERNIDNDTFDFDNYKIAQIQDVADFGQNYIENITMDAYIRQFIDYAEFGEYLANCDEESYCYCSSSQRVIIWDFV